VLAVVIALIMNGRAQLRRIDAENSAVNAMTKWIENIKKKIKKNC
jgi:hypothetical protein